MAFHRFCTEGPDRSIKRRQCQNLRLNALRRKYRIPFVFLRASVDSGAAWAKLTCVGF